MDFLLRLPTPSAEEAFWSERDVELTNIDIAFAGIDTLLEIASVIFSAPVGGGGIMAMCVLPMLAVNLLGLRLAASWPRQKLAKHRRRLTGVAFASRTLCHWLTALVCVQHPYLNMSRLVIDNAPIATFWRLNISSCMYGAVLGLMHTLPWRVAVVHLAAMALFANFCIAGQVAQRK
jgi:hypothetical protein